MKTKKSLGQHFLKSEKALTTIINTGEIKPGETILEIGPGQGALTEKLLALAKRVIAVEKDDDLYEMLKQKFEKEIASGKLILIHDDILNFDPISYHLEPSTYKLVANIPYNITGAILKKFLGVNQQPERMVLLVQKEVAERIVGPKRHGIPTGEKGSILSISVAVYGTPKYIETVKAGSFAPMPKVDSAIIAIENISKEFFIQIAGSKDMENLEERFFKLLRAGFSAKRKKLSSNLSNIFEKKVVLTAFQNQNLKENVRAEELTLENWKNLARTLLI